MIVQYEVWKQKIGYGVPDGTEIKPLLLFYGQQYYPGEGIADLEASGDNLEELRAFALGKASDDPFAWWQIVDHAKMKTILTSAEEED